MKLSTILLISGSVILALVVIIVVVVIFVLRKNSNSSLSSGGDQEAPLRITNNWNQTLWIEARQGGNGAPIPGEINTTRRLDPGESTDYNIPKEGLVGTRFWAKWGCDQSGRNCKIGDQLQYWPNPPGGCPEGGCTPPIDSLFEATWGCSSAPCAINPADGQPLGNVTYFNTSHVDGYTLPYKVIMKGDFENCDCDAEGNCTGLPVIDATNLDVSKCPTDENLSMSGSFPTLGSTDLTSVDLRIVKDTSIVGCISPCKKLNFGQPFGLGQSESVAPTLWMCCPTPDPDHCTVENGCVTAQECSNGPIVDTKYVQTVRSMAPGIYTYAYDDAVGLHTCPVQSVKFEIIFYPPGSPTYPVSI